MKRFIDKENHFELNAVVDREPMQLLEDGGDVGLVQMSTGSLAEEFWIGGGVWRYFLDVRKKFCFVMFLMCESNERVESIITTRCLTLVEVVVK